ncbi:MAG: hypothetical protein WD847_18235 [Pirellulales bacterium]
MAVGLSALVSDRRNFSQAGHQPLGIKAPPFDIEDIQAVGFALLKGGGKPLFHALHAVQVPLDRGNAFGLVFACIRFGFHQTEGPTEALFVRPADFVLLDELLDDSVRLVG